MHYKTNALTATELQLASQASVQIRNKMGSLRQGTKTTDNLARALHAISEGKYNAAINDLAAAATTASAETNYMLMIAASNLQIIIHQRNAAYYANAS